MNLPQSLLAGVDNPSSPRQFWRSVALAALAYFLAAKIGLLLSLPSGFVSPLWPAAGLAFLLVLRLGYGCMLGVAAGSLVSNLTAGPAGSLLWVWPDWQGPLWQLSAVAAGAAAQAGLGAWLIKRVVQKAAPGPFTFWAILQLCFRAGLLACLVNALVAAMVLPSFVALPWSARWTGALVWWLGDALGVLGLMPLALFLLRPPLTPRPWLSTPALVALSVAVLSWLATVSLGQAQTQDIKRQQSAQVAELGHHLQIQLDRTQLMLESFCAFYEATQQVTAAEFERFARPWVQVDSAVTAIAWAPQVLAAERASFEAAAPGWGAPLVIRERIPNRGLIPALPRAAYWPLTLLVPDEHKSVRGFDLASEPQRLQTLQRALQQDASAITGRLQLASDFGTPNVSVVLIRRIKSPQPAVLVAAIRINRLIESELKIFDSSLPIGTQLTLVSAGETLLNHSLLADDSLSDIAAPIAASSQQQIALRAADRNWQLTLTVPVQNTRLLGSAPWWLGQVMPQLLAIVLGLALVNGGLRSEHMHLLETTLNQLASRGDQATVDAAKALLKRQDPASSQSEQTLAVAWARGDWQTQYTPVINLDSGLLRAIDCKPQWPQSGSDDSSSIWLAWAERNDTAAAVNRQLLDAMLADSHSWPLRRSDAFHLNLPISAAALTTFGWVSAVLEALTTHRFPTRRLCLSLDEHAFINASPAVLLALQTLRDAGVRIGLSGFSASQSALAALQRLPVNRLLLDSRLVAGLGHDARVREIIRTLVLLAASHDTEIIADGVETSALGHSLRGLGCKLAQGNLFPVLGSSAAVAQALVSSRSLWLSR